MTFDQTTLEVWDPSHYRLAIDAAGVALWAWNVDNDLLTMDERAFALWDVPTSASVTFEDLSSKIHPADRDRVRAAFAATRAVLGAYDIDFRIMVRDTVRWISARGQGDDVGLVGRIMFGVFIDVTKRKQAEEAHELLAGEMSHRVKNLLTIATGLTAITSRSAATAQEMAHDLTNRLISLGRAHDLVRPSLEHPERIALLGDLLSVVLAPYDDTGDVTGRVRVVVPRMIIGERAATTLAIVLHELATNAMKYGAFSVEKGTLDLSCTVHADDVTMIWTERGGPLVVAPKEVGFGSRLVTKSMSNQLHGSISYSWSKEGVIITLQMNRLRLAT